MQNKIIQQLNWRYATKVFDKNKKISESDLNILLESLRLSPSSHGLQPWKFLVIKNEEIKERIKEASNNQLQVTDASDLIVLCIKTDFGEVEIDKFIDSIATIRNMTRESLEKKREGLMKSLAAKSKEEKLIWAGNQVYIALGFLLQACALMKIDSCPMEGFDKNKVDEILGLPEKGLASVVMCPVGYRSNEDKYATMAKVRFGVAEVVEIVD